MPWYKAGTVSVAQNSNAVTGTGTSFIANSRVGDAFLGPDGRWYEVTNIASDTAMAISPNYLGAATSAGTYALAPMQGYVKDSADALRALVNQFGTKLAALGTTGNYDTLPVSKGGTGGNDQATARNGLGLGAVATEGVVPVAKGGTGSTTPAGARTALQLGSAALAAVLGTVAQVGGVPTGAIVETGSNVNGTYIRWADGTQICHKRLSLNTAVANPVGNVFYSGGIAQTGHAVSFVGIPTTLYSMEDPSGISWITGGGSSGSTLNAVMYIVTPTAVATRGYVATVIAIGRWF